MDLLKKLDKVILLQEATKEYTNAFEFITALKKKLRTIIGDGFLKVTFDSGYAGNGMVFVKYANVEWKKAKEKDLRDSKLNFIIAIDGFDDEGEVDDTVSVEMFKFIDEGKSMKKIRKKKSNSLGEIYRHVVRYFQDNDEEFSVGVTEDGIGGMTAQPAPVSTDVSGGTTSSRNIAAVKKRLGDDEEEVDESSVFTSINKLPINPKTEKKLKKKYGNSKA